MISITVPSSVATGSSNGRKEMAQQLKGRRRSGMPSVRSLYPPPSVRHSVAVMYPRSLEADFFPMLAEFGEGVPARGLRKRADRAVE